MIRAVYLQQYGCWWKLSVDDWRKICLDAAEGKGYTLPEQQTLCRRSPLIGATNYNDGLGRTSYYPLRDDILVVSPLDWEPESFRAALQELDTVST